MTTPHIPVSWGEVIDKITILQIKRVRLPEAAARAQVESELTLLEAILATAPAADIGALMAELKTINESLWEIEDAIRAKEAGESFDAEFIRLARSVYQTNDRRSTVKKQINSRLPSAVTEQKSYHPI